MDERKDEKLSCATSAVSVGEIAEVLSVSEDNHARLAARQSLSASRAEPELNMTTPERWQNRSHLAAALECEPAGRAAFLDDACAGDDELRQEVKSLLAHDPADTIDRHAPRLLSCWGSNARAGDWADLTLPDHSTARRRWMGHVYGP